jgi:hypothetical protein
MQDSFFEFEDEQVLGEGLRPAFLKSWSLQLLNDTKMSPQLKRLFFIVTSIVYDYTPAHFRGMSPLKQGDAKRLQNPCPYFRVSPVCTLFP